VIVTVDAEVAPEAPERLEEFCTRCAALSETWSHPVSRDGIATAALTARGGDACSCPVPPPNG
jgi:hypothetical protein